MTIQNDARLMTRRQVERRVGLGRSAIYKRLRANTFPKPVKISRKAVRWQSEEIERWIAELPRGSYAEIAEAS